MTTENIFPSAIKAEQIEYKIRFHLHSSLCHLIELGEDILPGEQYQALIEKINFATQENRTSAFLYSLNARLIEAAEAEDEAQYHALCRFIETYDFIKAPFTFEHVDELCQDGFVKNLCLESTRKGDIQNTVFEPKIGQESTFEHSKKITLEALELLKDVLPEFYQEAHIFVKELLFFKAKEIRQGTSFDLFGLIYIRERGVGATRIDMIDCLVHEVAHLYLYALSAFDPIILNDPADTLVTPFRDYKRPVMGVYHAVFVLARLIIAFEMLLQSDSSLSDYEIVQINSYLKEYHIFFEKGFQTISTGAKLTQIGNEIMNSAYETIQTYFKKCKAA